MRTRTQREKKDKLTENVGELRELEPRERKEIN